MKNFTHFYEIYMNIMGPLTNLMFYIQAYKIFTEKRADSISLPAFFLSAVGLSSWLLYGILLHSKPLIIANLVGTLGAFLVLYGTIRYKNVEFHANKKFKH